MATTRIRTLNFLPEIFKTVTNTQFLQATLDQLVDQPNLEKIQGYVGSKFGYGTNANSHYVTEPTKTRTDYQLDPGVVFLKENTSTAQDFISYPGIIDGLKLEGGVTNDNNRLFNSQFYSWDPFVGMDKIINFNQYYWLPEGAPEVQIIATNALDVLTDILGNTAYISPNGVVFTNGLKVAFSGDVFPSSYLTGQYYVQGVGTAIQLIATTELIVGEPFSSGVNIPYDSTPYGAGYFDASLYIPITPDYITMGRNSISKNAWSRSNRWFHIDVINATATYNNDPAIATVYATAAAKAKRPILEFYPNLKLFDSGIYGKQPVDFIDTRTTDAFNFVAGKQNYYPDIELYTRYNATLTGVTGDTTTITLPADSVRKQSAMDTSVIGTFQVGQYISDSDNILPSNTRIVSITETMIGIVPSLILVVAWNQVLTLGTTLGLSLVASDSATGNYALFDGAKIIFTVDSAQKNKIYVARFSVINPGDDPIITLTEDVDGDVMDDGMTFALRGFYNHSKDFYFPVSHIWQQAQQKNTVNQAPLFDIFDSNGISFSDTTFYTGSSFTGTTLFSYGIGSGLSDSILGFPIRYSSVDNVGDISFDVSLNSDTFNYVKSSLPVTQNINTGYVYNYTATDYIRQLGWQTAVAPSVQYQIFSFDYVAAAPTSLFVCDVAKNDESSSAWPTIQVYINNVIQPPASYVVSVTANTTAVSLVLPNPLVDTIVQILVLSDQVSTTAYYGVPSNLNNNPLNAEITVVNVGDVRRQYQSIFYNSPNISGAMFGPNNYRDLGNLVPYGTSIIQNSASLVLPATFLRKQNHNLFNALLYNSREYITFKTLLVNTVNNTDFSAYQTASFMLDDALSQITDAKTDSNSFFWSDMLPSKSAYINNSYMFNNSLDTSIFPLSRIYDFTKANYYGVLIYLTRTIAGVPTARQLITGLDYVISDSSPSVTVTTDLLPGDTVNVREYNQTYGSYVPNTPSKLGLYPASVPAVILDSNYAEPTYFILGHDGSYNKLYGTYDPSIGRLVDFRDQVLLEFEKRIYNNLKISSVIPIKEYEVMPGFFRDTGYSQDEILEIYAIGFLNWVGQNRVDYKRQYYDANNEYTFNYYQSANKINKESIQPGYWRGVYEYFYDTTTPDTTPWEMLGFTNMPSWWETRYGPAPYTSDNLVLWGDLAAGIDWNNGTPVVIQQAIRPELLQIIPVDSAGDLVSPFVSIVGNYSGYTFKRDWKVGDMGPVELSYRRSSSYPFDLMRILALTKPAEFFNLGVDLDNYKYNAEFNQYLVNDRSHLVISNVEIYGSGTAKTSYINWIVDYEKQVGIDATTNINTLLDNVDVRLVYRLAGFSDKNMLKFYVEKGTPNSTNSSLLIPDESYSVLLYDNQPFDRIIYSSVVIQITANGFKVFGNSQLSAYFTLLQPKINGNYSNVEVESLTTQVANEYFDTEYVLPYGTEFLSVQEVSQFLVSYGKYLESQGVIFDQITSGLEVNWKQMVAEFLYWIQMGWEVGSIINVNPAASLITIDAPSRIVQPLTLHQQNFILNQNLYPIQANDMSVVRDGTAFSAKPLNQGDTVSYGTFNISNFEHGIVFDNVTLFNDVIYNLITGLRQNRLLVRGTKTAEWNGTVDAQGFILNQDNIQEWSKETKYTTGSIVKYKNRYWIAIKIVQASELFNEQYWKQTDYNEIQKGLLPNPSTRSYESTLYYDVNQANLENDADLLSFSLIGYRPRDYLALADLTDITQVNVYKNMIKNKGTLNAASAFKGASLAQGGIDYDLYENWAIKSGEYGGVLNSNFVEFRLNETELSGNPSIVGLTNGVYTAGVEQEVPIYSLFNYGRPISNPDILPLLADNTPNTLFPDAGYVNFNDVKMSSYFYSTLSTAVDVNGVQVPLTDLFVRDYVWIATTMGTWQVLTPTSLGQILEAKNNFNGSVTIVFNQLHGLSKYQSFAIINLDANINGYYTVTSVVDPYRVNISLTLNPSIKSLVGQGIGVSFQSQRVDSPRDIINLPLLSSEFIKNTVWVDTNTDGNWAVYRKSINYKHQLEMTKVSSLTYGSAVAYSDALGYLIGDADLGEVYRYAYNQLTKSYPQIQTLTGGTSFGSTIAYSGNVFVISEPTGTPTCRVYSLVQSLISNELVLVQTISAPPGVTNWGKSIAISGDQTWIYISDINHNSVYVYRRSVVTGVLATALTTGRTYTIATLGNTDWNIPAGTTDVEYIIGSTFVATMSGTGTGVANDDTYEIVSIIDGNALSLTVTGDNFGYSLATNYYGDIVVVGTPNKDFDSVHDNWGYAYVFDRVVQNIEAQLTGSNQSFPLVTNMSSTVLVSVNGTELSYTNYSTSGTTLNIISTINAGDIINVSSSEFVLEQTLTSTNVPRVGVQFGHSVDTTAYSSEILVGAPFELNNQNQEGAAYRFTNGGAKYGIITGTSECNLTTTASILINGYAVTLYGGDAAYAAAVINASNITNVYASSVDNKLTIQLIDTTLATPNDKLILSVINSSTLGELGMDVYTMTQIIVDPHATGATQFGTTVKYNEFGSVVISAPADTRYSGTTFDFIDDENFDNDTIFDNNSTQWVDTFANAGAVYMFDYLSAYGESLDNPGNYVYAQSVNDTNLEYGAQPMYGQALDFNNNRVVIGTPNFRPGFVDGQVTTYISTAADQDWAVYRNSSPVVDINRIQDIQLFSALTNTTLDNLDYIDPLQGKVLGVVRENLDVISNQDPAGYNSPNSINRGAVLWGAEKVGKLWFNTTNTKFVNYHQNDVVYNSKYWGTVFPGSDVAVFSWVASNVPPSQYQGPGTPLDPGAYSIENKITSDGRLAPVYFFWARNTNVIFTKTGKTLSDTIIQSYLTSPRASGISYFAPIQQNIFSLFNSGGYVNATDTVLHIGFSTGTNDDVSHSIFNLIRANYTDDFLPGFPGTSGVTVPGSLYNKLLVSLCGVDESGAVAPNPYLPKAVQYGILSRPNQSFFINRYGALKNYLMYANEIMAQFPIVENKQMTFFLSKNPTIVETIVAGNCQPGITYTIVTAGSVDWTAIGASSNTPGVTFVANSSAPVTGPDRNTGTASFISFTEGSRYDTSDYWNYIDWWATGYNNNTKASLQVGKYSDLLTLPATIGLIVTVALNGNGKSETYIYETDSVTGADGWTRIGLQDGTIEISSALWDYQTARLGFGDNFFDTTPYSIFPSDETRNIVRGLNEEIYTNELLIYRNKSLVLLFEYIQSETIESQNYLPWLNKTSLLDVSHTIRELLPLKVFQSDNQDFLAGYINEIKPYHVVIKEFIFKYTGMDVYEGDITDFDLPAQFTAAVNGFVTPELVYTDPDGDNQFLPSDSIWQSPLYSQWYANYGLSLTGNNAYPIARLTSYTTLRATSITVDNAYGFPINGTIQIGEEIIGYSTVDRTAGVLGGLSRGLNDSQLSLHVPGQQIYMDLPAVIVLDGSRGYTSIPAVTAYIDTSIYPEPTTPAVLAASINAGGVISIEVVNPGDGYAVLPEIIIEPADSFSFSPADDVDFGASIITLTSPNLITGDLVRYTVDSGATKLNGLTVGQHYYVRVVNSYPSFMVALYSNYADAFSDQDRIVISPIIHWEGTTEYIGTNNLELGARASTVTTSAPIRENQISLRFDRTSYSSHVVPWVANGIYGASSDGLDNILSSSSVLLESSAPPISSILASNTGLGTVLPVLSVQANDTLTWSSRTRDFISLIGDVIKIAPSLGGTPDEGFVGPTLGFYVGMPVKFGNTVTTAGTIYYVSEIINETDFTVSSSALGPVVTPTLSGAKCFVGQANSTAIVTLAYSGIIPITATTSSNLITAPITLSGQGGTDGMYVTLPVTFTGNTLTAGSFVPGQSYTIQSLGTTDFTLVGASVNKIGVPFVCTGVGIGTGTVTTVFGGIVLNDPYYINTVVDNQHFTISTTETPNSVNVTETIPQFKLTAQSTSIVAPNAIYGPAMFTTDVEAGYPVIFTGTPLGGIMSGTVYFIKEVLDDTSITISATPGGPVITLLPATGTMIVNIRTVIVCDSTLTMQVTDPVIFNNMQILGIDTTSFGGINTGTTYYISQLLPDNKSLIISTTLNGVELPLTIVPSGSTTGCLMTDQKNTVQLNTGIGSMMVTLGTPVSPGQLNGQQIDLYHQGATNYYDQYYLKVLTTTTCELYQDAALTLPVDGNAFVTSCTSAKSTTATASTASGNVITVDDVSLFAVGDALVFTGEVFGNIVAGTTYYMRTNGVTISLSATTVTSTSSTGNVITCRNTAPLGVNTAVVFSGNLGGIIAGTEYYVKTILNSTSFTISATLGGPVFVLTTASGTIVAVGPEFTVTDAVGSCTMATPGDYMLLEAPIYFDASIVKFNHRLYECIISNNDSEFLFQKWTLLQSDSRKLNALDRIVGYYEPTVNMPGMDMTQLVEGITYPNSIYLGNAFAPDDEFTLDTLLSGPLFTPADPTVYDIQGESFLSGYGPEELVPGVVTDNLSMLVTTRPGTNWPATQYGHVGYRVVSEEVTPTVGQLVFSFANMVSVPAQIAVFDITDVTGLSQSLYVTRNYTVNWINKTLTLLVALAGGHSLRVDVYEVGNGDQLVKSSSEFNPIRNETGHSEIYLDCDYLGSLTSGSGVINPATDSVWTAPIVFVNGVKKQYGVDYLFGLAVDGVTAKIVFTSTYSASTDYITYTVFGETTPQQYGYTLPETQTLTALPGQSVFNLTNYVAGDNPTNAVVELNGLRLDPAITPYTINTGAETLILGAGVTAGTVVAVTSFNLTDRQYLHTQYGITGKTVANIILISNNISEPLAVTNVTNTAVTTNYITCDSTVGFIPSQTIIFKGTGFGGIATDGTVYFVRAIINSTTFTISHYADLSDTVTLFTAAGLIGSYVDGQPAVRVTTGIPHGFTSPVNNNLMVRIDDTVGSYQLNNNTFYVHVISNTSFDLYAMPFNPAYSAINDPVTTINSYISGGYVWRDSIFTLQTTTVTSTAALSNILYCDSTAEMVVDTAVIFTGTTFGNIVEGTTYFINSIDIDGHSFKVSESYQGVDFSLSTAAGSMTITQWEQSDTDRLWVTVNGRRVSSGNLHLNPDNNLSILTTIGTGDKITITSMMPSASPNQMVYIQNTDKNNQPSVYRANTQARTWLVAPLYSIYDAIYVDDITKLTDTIVQTATVTDGAAVTSVGLTGDKRVISQVTVLNTTTGLSLSASDINLVLVDIAPTVEIAAGSCSTGDILVVTTLLGNLIYINGEQIRFTEANPILEAGRFTIGQQYVIQTLGTTDFVALGATSNTVGLTFTATDLGTGSGTAMALNALGGLQRGVNGTGVIPVVGELTQPNFAKYTEVYGLLSNNRLPGALYTRTWSENDEPDGDGDIDGYPLQISNTAAALFLITDVT